MEWTPDEYKRQLMHPKAEAQFKNDIEAMRSCDACVLVLPCGRSAHSIFCLALCGAFEGGEDCVTRD